MWMSRNVRVRRQPVLSEYTPFLALNHCEIMKSMNKVPSGYGFRSGEENNIGVTVGLIFPSVIF